MASYYGYEPTHRLDRPVALVSFVNRLTGAVAHSLASTTGLPLRVLDDLVEHRVGASIQDVCASSGLPAWRAHERDALAKTVRSQPPAVIALGEGALADPQSLELVLRETDLVYLYLSFEEAYRLAKRQSGRAAMSLAAEIEQLQPPESEDGAFVVFTRRRAAYERAPHTIDVFRRAPREIANRITRTIVDGASPSRNASE